MFERFTKDAREVVTGSVEHSERACADSTTEEHLLLATLDQEGTRTSFAFASLGITDRRGSVENALADARRRGGLSKADEEALAGLGIDVAEIVSKGRADARGGGAAGGPHVEAAVVGAPGLQPVGEGHAGEVAAHRGGPG